MWATIGRGIFNEIYWPAVDQPQVKDLGFLISGPGWWQEVKRAGSYTLSTPEPGLLLPTIVHTGRNQAYQLTLRPVVNPDHDALLIGYDLAGEQACGSTRCWPRTWAPARSRRSRSGRRSALTTRRGPTRRTSPCSPAAAAASCACSHQPGFTRAGAGYVGDTDGWTDFSRNQSMTLTYSQAGPGVVALTGELAAGSGLLALGFGDSQDAARSAAQVSLDAGYDATAAAFTRGWQAWTADLTLPGPAQLTSGPAGLADALRESAVVLRTHADRTVAGAYVAGLAIPWGNYANDPGGYHMVWCRDSGETALALAAAGHADDAVATLGYLAGRQNRDGSWPHCGCQRATPGG